MHALPIIVPLVSTVALALHCAARYAPQACALAAGGVQFHVQPVVLALKPVMVSVTDAQRCVGVLDMFVFASLPHALAAPVIVTVTVAVEARPLLSVTVAV